MWRGGVGFLTSLFWWFVWYAVVGWLGLVGIIWFGGFAGAVVFGMFGGVCIIVLFGESGVLVCVPCGLARHTVVGRLCRFAILGACCGLVVSFLVGLVMEWFSWYFCSCG